MFIGKLFINGKSDPAMPRKRRENWRWASCHGFKYRPIPVYRQYRFRFSDTRYDVNPIISLRYQPILPVLTARIDDFDSKNNWPIPILIPGS